MMKLTVSLQKLQTPSNRTIELINKILQQFSDRFQSCGRINWRAWKLKCFGGQCRRGTRDLTGRSCLQLRQRACFADLRAPRRRQNERTSNSLTPSSGLKRAASELACDADQSWR